MTKCGSAVRPVVIVMLTCVVSGASVHAERAGVHAPTAFRAVPRRAVPRYGELPILFEPNEGQAPPQFAYVASGTGYRVALSEQGLTLALPSATTDSSIIHPHDRAGLRPFSAVHLRLIGAVKNPVLRPVRRQASYTNYFIGNDPAHWRTHVPNFAAIRYKDVYPGIDWIVYGNRRHLLEYDLVVHAHADPARIVLAVTGAEYLSLDRSGKLVIDMHGRVLCQLRPIIYQVSTSGARESIKGRYTLSGGRVRIAVGLYDHTRTLYIDPALAYSTYLGGTIDDQGGAIAVDGQGDVYVTGEDGSTDFPTVDPYQAANPGTASNAGAAFIAKFDPSGTRLLYSTYFGGSEGAEIHGLAVDSVGSIYVSGTTESKDFPLVNAFQSQFKGTGQFPEQGFVAKFSPDGSTLEYSTYLGGSGVINDIGGLAIDSEGDAYVAGDTDATDFPTTAQAIQGSLRGRVNVTVSEFNPSGNGLVYSTYLGGSAADFGGPIAVDASGDAYVAGSTNSTDFPLVHPFQSTNFASAGSTPSSTFVPSTAFVAKIGAGGTALDYSSYLGGSGFDEVLGIAVDSAGNAYVTGETQSTDFPTVNAFQATNRDAAGLGGPSAFVTKINATGTALVYSTYLGGSGGGVISGDLGLAIAVDAAGDAYITGSTSSTDFPTVNAVQETNNAAAIGATNAFVSELDATGSKLLFSTYLGGSGSFGPDSNHTTIPGGDSASGIALDSAGGIYVVGTTSSNDFPTVNAFQSTNKTTTQYGANQQAFVAKFGVEQGGTQSSSAHGGGGEIGWGMIGLLTLALGFRWRMRNTRGIR